MLFPQFLQLVLSYLKNSELLLARQVNLRWNAICCSILRSRSFNTKIPPSKLKRFLKLMQHNISNPFVSYAIRIDDIREKNTSRFLTQFSPRIKCLRVRLAITELMEFSKLLQKMKHLKVLHLIVFTDSQSSMSVDEDKRSSHLHLPSIRGYHWDSLKVSDESGAWELGLYNFPHLKLIHFESFDDSWRIHPFYDQIVANIITASSNLKEMRFKSWNSPLGKILSRLEITSPGMLDSRKGDLSKDDLINLFFHLNMRFYNISLEITPEIKWELIQDVIHKSNETLQELTVANEDIFERFYITSALRQLVRLRLNYWAGPVDFSYFTRQFPSLRQISLNLSNLHELESGQVRIDHIAPCKTIKTLTLTRLDVGVGVTLMEKLSILFPNVTELFVEVKSGKVLEKIYQVYPELYVLCVELNTVGEVSRAIDNQSFTGIPEESMRILSEKDCGCPELEFREEERSCWNIGCLRNLRTLLMRVPHTVNNISLLEGISRLENLQNLVLLPFYYNGEEPTKWCLRAVADNFRRLKTLVTSTEVEYDDSELQYLRSKMPNLIMKKKQ